MMNQRLSRVAIACFALTVMVSSRPVLAQSAENVAVVINDASPDSQRIGQAYASARSIPDSNILHIRTATTDNVAREMYEQTIEGPLAQAIARNRLQDRILYLVLTKGVPLRIEGTTGREATTASVDSELTLLYRRMLGQAIRPEAAVANPYFLGDRDLTEARPFSHHAFDFFLVSRLDGFSVDDVLALIERGLSPRKNGRVVLDQRDALVDRTGDSWLEMASKRLADQGLEEVMLERTPKPVRNVTDVLGYFSWGSTDPQNRVRSSGITFAPGAIAATFVGSGARTFREPPATWIPTGNQVSRSGWYAGSPESLIADLIRDGVTGAAGYVSQPFLVATIRPQILFPAYFKGFSLVEAFYLAMPTLSWQTVIVGDPLCAPFRGDTLSRSELETGIDSVTQLPELFSKRRMDVALRSSPGIPEQAVALTLRAETLILRGDSAEARKAVEDALKLAPRFVAAMVIGAALDESAGRRVEAMEAYRRILEIDASHTVALNNLAYALAVQEKKPLEALPFARRAVSTAPESPTVIDTLAWIQHLLGDDAGAAKLMDGVVRGNIMNPEIRLHAAIIFAKVGRRVQAQAQLASALKLNPMLADSAEVKQLQEQLSRN